MTGTTIALVVLGALLAAAVGGAVLVVRRRRAAARARGPSHQAIFAGLCRVHGLDRKARRLLKNLAQACVPEQPARVFLEPAWLDQASAQQAPVAGQPEELQQLRRALFKGVPPQEPGK